MISTDRENQYTKNPNLNRHVLEILDKCDLRKTVEMTVIS